MYLLEINRNVSIKTCLFIVQAKAKEEAIKESQVRYLNNCAWLIATDKRAENMPSYEEVLKEANGEKIIDTRTSEDIIKDTLEMYR